jgi:hypothetical protein
MVSSKLRGKKKKGTKVLLSYSIPNEIRLGIARKKSLENEPDVDSILMEKSCNTVPTYP